MEYKISEYARMRDVCTRTVWNWIYNGELKTRKTPTGRIRIIIDNPYKEKNVAIYARVSSSKNKDNLEKQKDRLVSFCNAKGYKVAQIVTEVGSGLNDKRPKLEKLLEDKSIDVIVVEHKDRLCRFGLNYIQKLLSLNNREIVIVNPAEDDKEDLVQDFVSIITSFCARIYGQRQSKRKTEKLIKQLEKGE